MDYISFDVVSNDKNKSITKSIDLGYKNTNIKIIIKKE